MLVSWQDVNRSAFRACWHFGYVQSWMQDHFRDSKVINFPRTGQLTEQLGLGREDVEDVPVLWLMASASYTSTLSRLLASLEAAGEPCLVHVHWVPDMKDTRKEGFILMGEASPSLKIFYFNYAKFLFLFEALLEAVTVTDTSTSKGAMMVVMDLDVQVFPGWTDTLRRCLEPKEAKEEEEEGAAAVGTAGADVCFLQQAAFGDRRLQQVNSGVLVFGGQEGQEALSRLSRVGSFLHALVARLQAQEVLARLLPDAEPVNFEQLQMNYILKHIRQHVEDGGRKVVRWGIYSPLVAYAGMFLTHAILTDTVHHATASNVHLKSKIRFMDASKLLVQDLKTFCPLSPSGQQLVLGPLEEFCFYFTGKDPHFGPLLPHYKLFAGQAANL